MNALIRLPPAIRFGALAWAAAILLLTLPGCGSDAYEDQFQKTLHPPPPAAAPAAGDPKAQPAQQPGQQPAAH